jgi:hypothetical protein
MAAGIARTPQSPCRRSQCIGSSGCKTSTWDALRAIACCNERTRDNAQRLLFCDLLSWIAVRLPLGGMFRNALEQGLF